MSFFNSLKSIFLFNKKDTFKESVYEIAFGDNAINRDFSENEVLETLNEFSEIAFVVTDEIEQNFINSIMAITKKLRSEGKTFEAISAILNNELENAINEIKENKIVVCPDCKFEGIPIKDYCKVHDNCGEYAFICENCGSLNVDELARNMNNARISLLNVNEDLEMKKWVCPICELLFDNDLIIIRNHIAEDHEDLEEIN